MKIEAIGHHVRRGHYWLRIALALIVTSILIHWCFKIFVPEVIAGPQMEFRHAFALTLAFYGLGTVWHLTNSRVDQS